MKVKRFDRESRILKFSVRELLPNPFLQEMPFAEGDLVRGSVMQVVPQGIYVDCSGYPCYIANTEFAGEIRRNYKAGDALRARILSIDPVQRKSGSPAAAKSCPAKSYGSALANGSGLP